MGYPRSLGRGRRWCALVEVFPSSAARDVPLYLLPAEAIVEWFRPYIRGCGFVTFQVESRRHPTGAAGDRPPSPFFSGSFRFVARWLTAGLFAGLSLDGTILVERYDANHKFYGTNVSTTDILT